MFREDAPERYGDLLFARFAGRARVPWDELMDFALNETPFTNPKKMLRVLEKRDLLVEVAVRGGTRRRGSFPEDKVLHIGFKEGP